MRQRYRSRLGRLSKACQGIHESTRGRADLLGQLATFGVGEVNKKALEGQRTPQGTGEEEGPRDLRVGESLPTTGRLKRLLLPSQLRLATHLVAGTPLEPQLPPCQENLPGEHG